MQHKQLLPLLLVLAVASAPALAEEIVYFTNGTSMPVESHSVEDGTIRLDLGDQAYVAFPVGQIDRIETADGKVRTSDSIRANRIVGSGPAGSVPSRQRRAWQGSSVGNRQSTGDSAGGADHNGIAVYRPYANSAAANKRQFSTVAGGNRAAASSKSDSGVIGTTRVGSRFVLPTPESEANRTPVGVSLSVDKPYDYRHKDHNKNRNDKNKKK